MLNLNPYLQEIEELVPGQTIKVNHTDCEAGEDTRQRLYITRTHADENKIVAYCHNCQQGGYKHNKSGNYRDGKHFTGLLPVSSNKDNTITEPPGLCDYSRYSWPTAARSWVIRSGLMPTDLDNYGIKYDPSSDRIYLPRYELGELTGYQLRSLHSYDKPKYLTAQKDGARNWTVLPYDGDPHINTVIVVEDLVSGIHIIRAFSDDDKVGVVVNHGTKVDPTMMYYCSMFDYVVVWLDNDNAHVLNQAKLMERTIAMYSPTNKVYRVEACTDPKHHTTDIIRDEIRKVYQNG